VAGEKDSTFMLVINLVALAGFSLGFYAGWRAIRRGRMPVESQEALLSWQENPAPAWHYDVLEAFLVGAHMLTSMALCILLLLCVNRAGDGPFSMGFTSPTGELLASFVDLREGQVQRLSVFIGGLSACFGAFVFGNLLSFPISRWRIRPVLVHLHPDGIIYGQTFSPWQDVTERQVDGSKRLIKLFTHSHPRSPSIVLHPPPETSLSEVERVLADRMPDAQPVHPQGGRWFLALLFCLALLLVLLGGIWLYRYVAEWAWFVYVLVIMGLLHAGRILQRI